LARQPAPHIALFPIMSAAAAQQPMSAFDAIDRNHDGVISREEFYASMQQGAQLGVVQTTHLYGAAPPTVYPGGMMYGAGNVPMEPVATMMAPPPQEPGAMPVQYAAAPTIYSAPPTIIQGAPQPVQMAPPQPLPSLPPTTVVADPVYATPQEPTPVQYTAPAPMEAATAPAPIVLPHQGEIKTMPAVYVSPQPVIQQQPQITPQVSMQVAPQPQPMMSLPATTVVAEPVYRSVQEAVPAEPTRIPFSMPAGSGSLQVQQAPPVYSAPPANIPVLPHQGEILCAPPVYITVPQQPVQIEVPPPETTAVAPPRFTIIETAPPVTTAVQPPVMSIEVAQPITTAVQQAPAEPMPVQYAAPQVAAPVYISGPPTTAAPVYLTAPAVEAAQTAPAQVISYAAPQVMQAPPTVTYQQPGMVPMEPVATMMPPQEPTGMQQQQFMYAAPQTVYSAQPQTVYMQAPQTIVQSQGGDLFDQYDTNHDGVISRAEFEAHQQGQ